LGVDDARAFRTAPEKFSTHVPIAVPLCNSDSKGILFSKGFWKLARSVHLKLRRSGGFSKGERHAVSMSNGRWSEISAQHEVRYNGNGRSFTITISKISVVVQISDRSSRRHNHVGVSPFRVHPRVATHTETGGQAR